MNDKRIISLAYSDKAKCVINIPKLVSKRLFLDQAFFDQAFLGIVTPHCEGEPYVDPRYHCLK